MSTFSCSSMKLDRCVLLLGRICAFSFSFVAHFISRSFQFYNAHHDTTPYYLERQFGHRIITVFLYLNDVEGGGETEFEMLGINVTAKKGKVVMWPSVLDSDPLLADGRTRHAALNVTKGVKYGANAWIHMGNFKDTYARGCI